MEHDVKALSLWQPWASAIALGHKKIETRHWATKYRGPIAIHAAKRFQREQRVFASTERTLGRLPERLPFGAIVAIAVLDEIVPIEQLVPSPIERMYGDYSPGRYGWILENIQALAEPIPFVGRQGLFNVPDDLIYSAAMKAPH